MVKKHKQKKISTSDRGKPVPLPLSEDEFARTSQGFCEAYQKFRQEIGLHPLSITPSILCGLRDKTPRRQVKL